MNGRNDNGSDNIDGVYFIILTLCVILWMTGIAIARGFFSTFFAVVFPPYSLYLLVERLVTMMGLA